MDFQEGDDLLLPDRQTPWCIPFHRLVSWAAHTPIRKQLLLDKLISERQIRSRNYVVSTLDHTRLTEADWIDISGMARSTISVTPADRESFTLACKYPGSATQFPRNAQGFLYWYVPKNNPYGAELRFRCVESLEHFVRGQDLPTPILQKPWSLTLRGLAQQRSPSSAAALEYLKQAGLTDESVVDNLAKMSITHMRDLFCLRFDVQDPQAAGCRRC